MKARKKAKEETEPVPEKRARRNSNNSRSLVRGPSLEETRPDNRKESEIRMERDNPMAYGNLVTVKVAERLTRERQKLRHTARQMEGLNPSGTPDAEELINSAMWYNWRMSNKSKRIPHMNLQKVRTVLEFLGVDSTTVR